MKHLRVLEEAGLITTRRSGREKLHYLNPVPIRLIHDRWISKYAEPFVGAMAGLKRHLEEEPMPGPKLNFEIYVRATPQQVWDAITDGDQTRHYFYGTEFDAQLRPGGHFAYWMGEGDARFEAVNGDIIKAEAPRELEMTWNYLVDDRPAEAASHVKWALEEAMGATKVTLVHDGFAGETPNYESVRDGWPFILSGLKTVVETGQPLTVGA
jgi:uncharacterized protein YndB with AHSA1/START domain